MTINKTFDNEMICLALEGRLDTSTAAQLQDVLIPALCEAVKVTIDFSKLVYVSSAGLRVLLTAQKTARVKGVYMKIKGVSEDIMEVFKMTGFSDILNIE